TLAERVLLNPGSAGGPAFHLVLQPPAGARMQWQAGDIAEIGPRNARADIDAFLLANGLSGEAPVQFQDARVPLAESLARARLPANGTATGQALQAFVDTLQPLPHREYSIASIPQDGNLQLLVRLMQREDGTPGIGSGWLCLHAAPGDPIDLRLRANPNFHAPDPATPLVLVGNGTGLAGLRAHLKARVAVGAHRNWLLFGERNAHHDSFHGAELEAWLHAGELAHLDRVYSRDGGPLRYVQDALRAQAPRLRAWLQEGAAIHVCGSLQGMAPGVDAVLVELLGRAGVDALVEAGRYRRDVY
ncbi:MAG: sulfite reductase flavoprotein subunit alpha, partial [Lysobacteraceae bacterium]